MHTATCPFCGLRFSCDEKITDCVRCNNRISFEEKEYGSQEVETIYETTDEKI